MTETTLTGEGRAMLDFEAIWPKHDGRKEAAIRNTFQLRAVRYYQLLNQLIDTPAALAAEPILVNRISRQRAERIDRLASRRFAKDT